jgi:serine protease Do
MLRRLTLLAGLMAPFVGTAVRADDSKQVSASEAKVVWDVSRTTAPDSIDELKAMQSLLKATVDKVMPSTVGLLLPMKGSAGSGVIVNEDGLVLTAAHVIEKPNLPVLVVLSDGTRAEGRTLGINSRVDSGMIKITSKPPKGATWPGAKEGKWPAVDLGKAVDLKKGQYVISLGHPGGPKPGRKPPVRLGQFLGANSFGRAIRSDCTLVGGDSGGPLFDMSGKLIGIHSRIGLDLETNIHVPIEAYQDDWSKMVKEERVNQVPQVTFGVKFNESEDSPEVLEVLPESPADNAGIQVGDRVTKFDGKKIERANDVYELLYDLKPGQKIKVEIRRGEERIQVETALAARARPKK